ncbi:MAG TPA: outer membrane beta-barrel protein [Bacteroidia bacterium]|nr:outer membrane beta-barrel protein [Bacteroidia bacterium]
MKKYYLLILIPFLFLIHTTNAQFFRGGLLLGGNLSAVDGSGEEENDNPFKKIGFTAGGFVNARVLPRTLFQLEMAYSQKGCTVAPNGSNDNNYYMLSLNYLDVTLAIRHNIHFNLSKKPTSKFDIECGLTMGKLVYDSYTVKSIITPISLNTTDISAFIGLVYNFSQNYCLDLRYYNSFIPSVQRNSDNSQFLWYGSWNRGDNLVFQLSFKVTFGTESPIEATPTKGN